MDKYEKLIFEANLYPSKFVVRYGTDSVHWNKDSWVQREMSLRHDMVCSLLCNMTHRVNALKFSPTPKKQKAEGPSTSSACSNEEEDSSNSAKLMTSAIGRSPTLMMILKTLPKLQRGRGMKTDSDSLC